MTRSLACIVAALLVLVGSTGGAPAAGRIALVVGNGAYENAAPLKNPAADADAIAGKLEALGFEVHRAIDATQAQLLEVLGAFTGALDRVEAVVFYYSGHGLQLGDENYLLPVDIAATSELAVRYGAVAISDVLSDIESRSDVTVVVLDACRDNPFAADLQRSLGRTRSVAVSRGLARMSPSSSGTIIAYAAAAGDVASDGDGDHSPFTEALLAEIDNPGAEIGLIFRRVAGRVIEATNGDQRPELLVRLTQEFYFSAPEATVENASAAPADPPAAAPSESGDAGEPDVADDIGPTDEVVVASAEVADVPDAARRQLSPARWGYLAALAPPRVTPPAAPWTPPPGQVVVENPGNDGIAAAQQIGASDTLQLFIHPRSDHDFAAVTVGQAGTLTLSATGVPAEIDLAAQILDGNLGVTAGWTSAPRPGGDFLLSADLPAPGTYVIEVADSSNDAESPATVDLALSFTPSSDLHEPNDTVGDARWVPIDDRREGTILPRGDADWFTVTAETPGELTLEATSVPEALDIAMRVLDFDDRVVLDWTTAPRPGGDTYAVADLARPGSYAIEVRDGSNDARSEQPFTFTTSFIPSIDPSEPNDGPATAYPVDQNGELPLTIFPRGDVDWLAVRVDQPGALEVAATGSPAELDVAMRVLTSDQVPIVDWVAAPRPGGDNLVIADLPRPGSYLIEVRDGSNDARSIEAFRLATRFVPAPDQYEPNDTIGTARQLTPGGAVAFNILPRGDADWFMVAVETPGALAVSIDEGPKELDIHFRVLDANRATIVDWTAPYSPGGLTEAVADLPRAGIYYIEIRDGANDARSVEHATLFTSFTPLFDSYEPNDSRARAADISLEGDTLAHILPRGDADLFRIRVERPGSLDIEIDQVPDALDIAFRVLDAGSAIVTDWVGAPRPGGVTTGSASFAAPGDYYIELRDGGNDARDPAPFRMRRTFRPAG